MTSTFLRLGIICVAFLLSGSVSAKSSYFPFMKSVIKVADSADAARFIKQKEAHVEAYSRFDIQSRLGAEGKHVTTEYYTLAAKQMRTWNAGELKEIQNAYTAIESFFTTNDLRISLPDTILVIKSTCKEEYEAAGYTRKNGIILKAGEVVDVHIMAHELFHVLSRHDTALRDKLYATIGFNKCNVIDMNAAMNGLNITNPDCPVVAHYIAIGGEDMVLALHSKKPYTGGEVFGPDYLAISLLVLEGGDIKKPKKVDDQPVLYSIQEKMELFSKVGQNTQYILHPEEICAEHFASLIMGAEVPQPEYLSAMKQAMR